MNSFSTPFGELKVYIDDASIDFDIVRLNPDKTCPDVLERIFIEVDISEYKAAKEIKCIFLPTCSFKGNIEPGERQECNTFCFDNHMMMSISAEGDVGCTTYDENPEFDYEIDYLDNGIRYEILENTKTTTYIFGVSWIDNADLDVCNERSEQTWFATDPFIYRREKMKK